MWRYLMESVADEDVKRELAEEQWTMNWREGDDDIYIFRAPASAMTLRQ